MISRSNDPPGLRRRFRAAIFAIAIVFAGSATAAPPAPTDVTAVDRPWDGGGVAEVSWTTAPDITGLEGFQVWRSETETETGSRNADQRRSALKDAMTEAETREYDRLVEVEGVALEDARMQARRVARSSAIELSMQKSGIEPQETGPHGGHWLLVDTVSPTMSSLTVKKLDQDSEYRFIVYTIARGEGEASVRSEASSPSGSITPVAAIVNLGRGPLFVILALLCGVVLFFIIKARRGAVLKIRKIAGLSAIDEAVGRATEMGRPMLFINGIQDMDDLQTVAGITVLGKVAKTAAEYDARIEVPTCRSLVMSAARETVQASYLTAGRTDAYNPDLIYYVTDEQFGFTAYVSGLIVRDRPAACFYMGAFFAESLILAETGNSVGAIQIAGTAMPSQLPFFVAACDYTLIGEEFFAASAYLSEQPEQLGSLKGQDMGKLLVGVVLVVGVLLATVGTVFENQVILSAVDWFKNTALTG
jgi:hypothetical protein